MTERNDITVTTKVSRTRYLSSDKETRKLEFVISDGNGAITLTQSDVEKLLGIFYRQGIALTREYIITSNHGMIRQKETKRKNIHSIIKLKNIPRNIPIGMKEIGRDFSHATNKSRPKSEYILYKNEKGNGYGYYMILNGIPSKYESVGTIEDTRTPIGKFFSLLKFESTPFSTYRVAKNAKYSWKRIKAMIKILELEGYIKVENDQVKGKLYSITQKGNDLTQITTS